MTETTNRIPLATLTRIRLACKAKDKHGKPCRAVVELPLDSDVLGLLRSRFCPGCEAPLLRDVASPDNPFKSLSLAIESLGNLSGNYDIEFPVPADA